MLKALLAFADHFCSQKHIQTARFVIATVCRRNTVVLALVQSAMQTFHAHAVWFDGLFDMRLDTFNTGRNLLPAPARLLSIGMRSR